MSGEMYLDVGAWFLTQKLVAWERQNFQFIHLKFIEYALILLFACRKPV